MKNKDQKKNSQFGKKDPRQLEFFEGQDFSKPKNQNNYCVLVDNRLDLNRDHKNPSRTPLASAGG